MYAPPAPADLLDTETIVLADGATLCSSDGTPLVASLYRSPWHPAGRRIVVSKSGETVFDPGARFDYNTAIDQLSQWVDAVVSGEVMV